jgi:ferredoxin-NADP reductase/predicted pyridoxine 5'-phosphate oxidase superfamily flavin-nucleotide-binding protein
MDAQTAQNPASPWHAGELALQRSVGAVEHMDRPGRMFVRNFLPEQHREFYSLLHFVALGSVDAQGQVWATLRAGAPGFAHSPDAQTLHVAVPRDDADPAEAGLGDGLAVGLLGLDPMTRRRNRLNGRVRRAAEGGDAGFGIDVEQSFGNCPRYIQNRNARFLRDPARPSSWPVDELQALDARARTMIAEADSFYVASYIDGEDGRRQVDVSHRGGRPGFVRVGEDGVLTVPDFSGNLFFMTLGNILLNPRAGLVFVDPETGDMLQMTGEARVVLEGPEIAAFDGAERLWTFRPQRMLMRRQGLPLGWQTMADGASPHWQMTGSWGEAQRRLAAAALARQWRPCRVVRSLPESLGVRSLYLEPADGMAAPTYLAGQHLPVRLTLADGTRLVRSYTLSAAPSEGHLRISVSRQGAASAWLHGLREGDVVEALAPAGGFAIDAAQRRPAVLLAAGIGITPLRAMLGHIVHEARRTRTLRPTWLFQGARTLQQRPFDAEIAALVQAGQGGVRWIRALTQPGTAQIGRDYEHAGRIDMGLLQAHLPFGDYDFYLCGPADFMQSCYDGLRALQVADARIHAEGFGPSALRRSARPAAEVERAAVATLPVPVLFADSGKESRWSPGDGSLLELAEARGLSPAFGCRAGSCGSCSTRVLRGAVAYAQAPAFAVPAGQALLCCAQPARGQEALHLAL